MSGRAQYRTTARGSLRADASKKKRKPKDKNRDRRKRPKASRGQPSEQDTRVINNSDFEVYLNRSGGQRVRITEFIEQMDWSDSSDEDALNSWPSLTGSITMRQRDDVELPPLTPNTAIDCYCRTDSGSEFVWRMRIVKPTYSALDGTVNIELQDEIRQLSLPRGTFRFTADKKHKKGWTPREIAIKVCKDYKIPHGSFMALRINGNGQEVRIPKLEVKRTSPAEVIKKAYEEGRKRSAHRFVMRWNHKTSQFEIKPMKESNRLYQFTDSQISDAQIETRLRGDFCTAMRVTWWKPKPKKSKSKTWRPKKQTLKFFVYKDGKKVTSGRGKKKKAKKTAVLLPKDGQAVIQKYGYIERRVSFSAKDTKEARDKAQNMLAKSMRPVKSLSFTAPGEVAIRRGDFIEVTLPEQGFDGTQQMWVQSVTHSVAERYTMEVTARFDDPWSPSRIRKEQAAAKRYRKRMQKKDKAELSKGRGGGASGPARNLAPGQRPEKGVLYRLGSSTYGFTASDDNGKDVKGNSLFSGDAAVAELGQGGSVGGAMGLRVAGGGPDYGMKCRVSYGGKSVTGTFRDVGRGGGPVGGRPRVIDLHARVARELGLGANSSVIVEFERLT